MLNPENNASCNFVSPELKEWVSAEYEADYAARFADASGIADGDSLLACGLGRRQYGAV
jgi:hypothetical protein